MLNSNPQAKKAATCCTAFTALVILINIYFRVTIGVCPAYEPLDSFVVEDFTGVWYELQRDVNFAPSSGECVTAEYLARAEGGVTVENNEMVDNERNYIQGYALASGFLPGMINVFFGGGIFGFGADYRVIDTDYTSYAIIYSCEQFGPIEYNLSWLLVRDQIEESSGDYTTMINKVDPIYAEKIPNYDRDGRMRTTQQGTGCTYYN